jgi:hypothetical protein
MHHDEARRYRRSLQGTCGALALFMLVLFDGKVGYSQPKQTSPEPPRAVFPSPADSVANHVMLSPGTFNPPAIERKLPAVQLGPDSIVSNTVTSNKQAPVQFQPFPMVDPQTGKPVLPDTIITLPDGRKFKAGEYYASLNAIEQNFTKLGYSLRTMPKQLQLQETKTDRQLLQQQLAQVKPSTPQRLPAATLTQRFGSTLTTSTGQRVLPASELTSQTIAAVRADRNKTVEVVNNELRLMSAPSPASSSVRGQASNDLTPAGNLANAGLYAEGLAQPRTFHREQPWNWSVGSPGSFQAFLTGKFVSDGKAYPMAAPGDVALRKSNTEFGLRSEARAGGAILGRSFDLVNATAAFHAPANASKRLNAKLNISVLGAMVYNFNESADQTWTKENVLAHGLRVGVPFGLPLGPVWLGGEVGVKGSAGLRYGISMNRAGVGGNVSPFVSAAAYGEGGVNAIAAGGGVGVAMTFVNASLNLYANARLGWFIKFILMDEIYCDYELTMLAGRIYAFAYVYLPFLGRKQWEHNFWNWGGLKASNVLIDDKKFIAF